MDDDHQPIETQTDKIMRALELDSVDQLCAHLLSSIDNNDLVQRLMANTEGLTTEQCLVLAAFGFNLLVAITPLDWRLRRAMEVAGGAAALLPRIEKEIFGEPKQ